MSTARQVAEKFRKFKDDLPNAVKDGVDAHIDRVFDETQVRVPRETGALAGTGRVEKKPTQGTKISASIWYGEPGEGPDVVDYAAAVHEILDAKHAPPTGAKFVEQPLIESKEALVTTIAEKIDEKKKEAFR